MNWKAAKTSALLCVLFLIVYGGCNYLSSIRSDVGTWVYDWERLIPFVPAFIIPYMSIDLFFVAAPFVCRDEGERRILARRMALAMVVAGAFFLIMPLRFTFPRPHVEGPLGVIFGSFQQVDQPHNLVPSMHIALAAILAHAYSVHTRGLLRACVCIWFFLVGLSTLLVYQHHVVDVIGGVMLAGMSFYMVRRAPWRLPVSPNARVGMYYGIGAGVVVVIGLLSRPWGLWLLWPGLSLGLMCAAYYGLGPGVYAKSHGRIALWAHMALLPVLIGQQLSLKHYGRQCRPWDKVTETVWIGRQLSDREAAHAVEQGVSAILDLTCEFTEAKPFRAIAYLNVQVLDLTAPTVSQTRKAAHFIREYAANGIVYIHCKAGYSRTAAMAAAYLFSIGQVADAEAAMERLRAVRPTIVIRPEIVRLMRSWEKSPVQIS